MSKNLNRVLAAVMAAAMIFALVACGQKDPEPKPAEEDTRLAAEVYTADAVDLENYAKVSEEIYNANLGEYYKYLQEAKAELLDTDKRYVLMAIAEAKLMEACVYMPSSSNGGNYAIGRVVPNTVSGVLWGEDSYRYHDMLVTKEIITSEDRAEMKALYAQLKGTGTYYEKVKELVVSKGYTLKNDYSLSYASDPKTWDILNTYRSADAEAIVNCYDGLLEYDCENAQQPALAESFTVSDDGKVYTFKLRSGLVWTDSQGRKVADLTAKDFVAGMQHLLDAQGGLEYLAGAAAANIVNADEYVAGEITDFAQVGVKALDDLTVEYTLNDATPYFLSILGYNPFAPLCVSFFESKGGVFGVDAYNAAVEAGTYTYGNTPDDIAYCGPYTVTNATAQNTIVFSANPLYWNAKNIALKTITWKYTDGQDPTKNYNDMLAGVLDGSGLNTSSLELAKKDGNFDKYHYVSATDATSFGSFYNLNRQGFSLFTDATKGVSSMTVTEADRAKLAMQNVHFRRAISFGCDRAAYNAQVVGEELKYLSEINSYTPGNFVQLANDYTATINGKSVTFKAGTYYGAIMQAQIDADGVKMKVWDPTQEGGLGSSAGFDGWYSPENAREEMAIAVEELAKQGVVIDKDHPIVVEMSYPSSVSAYANRANACKQSIEASLEGLVEYRLLDCQDYNGWYDSGYYCDSAYECDYTVYDCSGWGPDYGDPATYLNTLLPETGDMILMLGIY